jgi:response regulator RpfG family c-di-GMP phosphodiesterase
MSSAIAQVVNVFVSLENRRRLEDMKLQRERAVLELQSQSGVSLPIR